MKHPHHVTAARKLFEKAREDVNKPALEIDKDPTTSTGVDDEASPGVWVQAWLWIPHSTLTDSTNGPE